MTGSWCSCVISGTLCRGCYPSRKGRCRNQPSHSHPEPDIGNLQLVASHIADPPLLSLPDFSPGSQRRLLWGSLDDSDAIHEILDSIYNEVVNWKPNLFKIPSGNIGKSLTAELSRLFMCFGTSSALESVAFKAIAVLPSLLLQRLRSKSKDAVNRTILERRLQLWKQGEFLTLLDECRLLQSHAVKNRFKKRGKGMSVSSTFANLMFQGKISEALGLLCEKGSHRVLQLNEIAKTETNKTVRQVLKDKHPDRAPMDPSAIVDNQPTMTHPVIFEQLDASMIRRVALNTKGAAGPSGLNAYCWRRLCTSFGKASDDLCQALALSAKRLCRNFVDPEILAPLLASRLIALDKMPGVRPIGVGETHRRIIMKAILAVTKPDILDSTGISQLCVGQVAGVESAVHSVQELFKDSEAVLLVDASNAFNSLNRGVALHNLLSVCPSIATAVVNCYREPSILYIDGERLYSQEGTTQGDPLSMPVYALATLPLINQLPQSVRQVWYADDATAVGSVANLRDWWDSIKVLGPKFGYFPNSGKTWLVTKEEFQQQAVSVFEGTNVNITTSGRLHLGVPVGSKEYVDGVVSEKVDGWISEIKSLSKIANTHPHAAYAALVHGLTSKWLYMSRTLRNIETHLERLEQAISCSLIPSLTNQPPPNTFNRKLFALPTRLGGLCIRIPSEQSAFEYDASRQICEPIVDKIVEGDYVYDYDCECSQANVKQLIK